MSEISDTLKAAAMQAAAALAVEAWREEFEANRTEWDTRLVRLDVEYWYDTLLGEKDGA